MPFFNNYLQLHVYENSIEKVHVTDQNFLLWTLSSCSWDYCSCTEACLFGIKDIHLVHSSGELVKFGPFQESLAFLFMADVVGRMQTSAFCVDFLK